MLAAGGARNHGQERNVSVSMVSSIFLCFLSCAVVQNLVNFMRVRIAQAPVKLGTTAHPFMIVGEEDAVEISCGAGEC